jgi:guanylate kinase
MNKESRKCDIIIFSAPSGSGKSTIVNHLLALFPKLEFSVSATSRKPRGDEQNGREYFFLSTDDFRAKIGTGEFVEYQEVYEGIFYGTLKSEVEKIWSKGGIVVFDVDVVGGVNLKRIFGKRALSVFIQPPSIKALRERLIARGTDDATSVEKRVAKAEVELTFKSKFDMVLVNDQLDKCLAEAEQLIKEYFNV